MKNQSTLLVGDNALLTQCAAILLREEARIAAIVTESEAVKRWALARDIPLIDGLGDWAAKLAAFEYDWLFSMANLRMVPESASGRARRGAINFHDGPLPERAGLNTPAWSLIEGRTTHGVSWHAITVGVDEGDVHASRAIDVSADDTAFSLNTKCLEAGVESFEELVRDIGRGTLHCRRQDLSQRTYYARRARPSAAGTLNFADRAETLSRLVRALTFGEGYANPLTSPKILTAAGPVTVTALSVLGCPAGGVPGEVLGVQGTGLVVAAADGAVLVEGATPLTELARVGDQLPVLDEDARLRLDEALSRVMPHEPVFRRSLARAEDLELAGVAADGGGETASVALAFPAGLNAQDRAALVLAFLARLADRPAFDVAFVSDELAGFCAAHPGYFAPSVPCRVEADGDQPAGQFLADAVASLADLRARLSYALDLVERTPQLVAPRLSVGIRLAAEGDASGIEGCALSFVLGRESRLVYDSGRVSAERAHEIATRLALAVACVDRQAPLSAMPLVSEAERRFVLHDLNATARRYDLASIHTLVAQQAERTPELPAVSFRGQSITYRELDCRAERLARSLVARGAGPGTIVGLHLGRGIELVVGAYAILKTGAAYLPLDPAFPENRLALMVEDSATRLILADRDHAHAFAGGGAAVVVIEALEAEPPASALSLPEGAPDSLAYVIYTSGSTGRPKGVMIEHRNVANFFAGMDERVPRVVGGRQETWLAVTSLSFDISVLEIFWTLARGFKVVVHASALDRAKAGPAAVKRARSIDFSLFYWGNDDGVGAEKYRTLIEGARFADTHGFNAVWTPERHFHAFGGPYPNPAVTGAAVAAVTKNLAIRAGSCVLPLHHPARVAEEWAVVDNLSNGRVGLAFASGWMPEDFVLRPENAPPSNKAAMLRDIETVRKLWRGESVPFDLNGASIDVLTQPRPMSRELPVWVTTAGNPETYRDAARMGANVLTHLLGQSIAELKEKIAIYRATLQECGRDPRDHKVTVMLHTLVGRDREQVRELAREPMKAYLRSAAALIKQYAWAFPAFKKPAGVSNAMEVDLQALAPDEMDAILEFAFLRYFEDSGLFGTPADAAARTAELEAIGVDEIACLIDFGLPSQIVLDALHPLAEVVAGAHVQETAMGEGLAADIRREGVTHLQCTPSMMGMFLGDGEDRAALAEVAHLFIGGEALRKPLLTELNRATGASVENMYGPTETTIWSSTATTPFEGDVAPLGRAIANTQLYVLDRMRQPVPPGVAGELFIGGEGVARGYLNRPELTAERFLPNPFAPGRIYRTGDLVRLSAEGRLDFIGRTDNQVKIRGNRIELGEIEARIAEIEGVREAVVSVREDRPGDKRIVAYLRASRRMGVEEVRAYLDGDLPEYMIPAHVMVLDAFPLTPNAKVDRNRLPPPIEAEEEAPPAPATAETGASEAERVVTDAFKRILGRAQVGRHDNFFALGGHSLLAVQMHRELKSGLAPALTITDLFRFPTVAGLAQHIAGGRDEGRQLNRVAERAAARRASLENRRAIFARTPNVA
ncbi:MAG: luciferase [Mesorhizobium amorphae]|nr:MAG: luciferase [Mesorhizobium amorphae]